MRTLYFLILCLGVFVAAVHAQGEVIARDPFPLSKGNYWIYKGKVEVQEPDTEQLVERDITWRMQVEDVFERDNILAALVTGHPQDVIWYEEGTVPGHYLIVRQDNRYYLLESERIDETLLRLQDPRDELVDLVFDEEMFLPFPLKSTSSISRLAQSKRLFTWVVKAWEEIDAQQLKLTGIRAVLPAVQYTLQYQTLPDDTSFDFIPGIGITQFTYQHHGAPSHMNLKLIEFSSG